MRTRIDSRLCIEGRTYTLSASRVRQYWLGEWSDLPRNRWGVVAAPCRFENEAIELAREAALSAHRDSR